jgi:hypothetical protein
MPYSESAQKIMSLFFSDFTRTPSGADFRKKIILDGDEHRQLIKKLVTKMMKKQL